MIFWVVSIVFCAVAVMCVLMPLSRSPSRSASVDETQDFYRSQLKDIDRQMDEGAGGDPLLNEQRAEIARRLIKASKSSTATRTDAISFRKPRAVAAVLSIIALPLVTFLTYANLGAPTQPDQPLSAQLAKDPTELSVQQLVQRAERHLKTNPDDLRGWKVLSGVYARLERPAALELALRQQIRLAGPSSSLLADLGEALSAQKGNVVSGAAKRLFIQALELDPRNRKAAFYVAISAEQEGQFDLALSRWKQLTQLDPTNTQWQSLIGERIAAAQKRKTSQAPGPSVEEVAAAAEMTETDRQSMIASMVDGLAGKLADDPENLEGWQRLIRAYSVLRQNDKAHAALERAESHYEGRAVQLAALDQMRKSLSLPEKAAK